MHTWTRGGLLFPWQPKRQRQTWEPHEKERGGGGGEWVFTVFFFCPSEEENKGPYTREGARIRSVQVAGASTMGLNFNKVKCRYAARLSLNEIALQAERVSSCCFCTALIMQPRSPRPRPYAHKVNTRRPATTWQRCNIGPSVEQTFPITANLQRRCSGHGGAFLGGFVLLFWVWGGVY